MWGRDNPALRPLFRYAEFRGRSTRTEIAAFALLALVANIVLGFVAGAIGPRVYEIFQTVFILALLCPAIALVVRRLHDAGWSGLWALLGLPGLLLALLEQYYRVRGDFEPLVAEEPAFVGYVAAAGVLALYLLVLLPDEDGPNRSGPNPRYGEPDAAA